MSQPETHSVQLSRIKRYGSVLVGIWLAGRRFLRGIRQQEAAAHTLREKGEQYHAVTATSMDGFWVVDSSGRLLDTNAAYCCMIGYSRDELLTMSISDIEAQEAPDETQNRIQQIMKTGGNRFETHHRRKDGHIIDVEVSTTFMPHSDHILAFLRDISEHKRAEEALASSNETLQALHRVALELAGERELSVLMRRIMDVAVELLNADRGGGIYLYDAGQDVLRLAEGSGINKTRVGFTLQSQEGVAGEVFQTARPLIVNNYTHWAKQAVVLVPDPPSAVMGVPLFIEGQVIGVLAVFADSSRRTFNEADIHLAEMFAAQAALALHNARLYEQARQEIAQRKEAEEFLRASETKYHDLVDNSVQGIVIFQDGRFVFVNPAMSKIAGYRMDEMIAMSAEQIAGLVHPDDRAWVFSNIQRRMAGLPVKPYQEHRILCANGEVRVVELFAKQIVYQNKPAVQATYIDITGRKQVEEALRESENMLRESQNIAGLGSYVLDIPSGLWKSSDVLDRIFGIDSAYAHSVEGWVSLIHPDDRAMMSDYFANDVLGKGRAFDQEYRIVRQDDQAERWVHGLGKLEFDNQGHPVKLRGTILDITERKQADTELAHYRNHLEELVMQRTAELQAANEQLLVLSHIKDEFVSNVSHELRTPITGLLLRQYLLRKQPEKLEEHLGVIEREVHRLEHTIEDLLRLSRLDQHRTEVVLAPLDLNPFVEQFVTDRALIAAEKGLTLSFEGQPDLPIIAADQGLLGQVLSILLTNATHYTPTGGFIRVKTCTRHNGKNQWAGLEVSDTGLGIALGRAAAPIYSFLPGYGRA